MLERIIKQAALGALVLVTGLGGALTSPLAAQAETPIIQYNARFHPLLARKGMVSAQERLATEAGRDMIAAGGNAIDAAVATGFALAVTYPQAGNIGGGGFMLAYLAKEQKVVAIDYREMAPSAADRDMFLDVKGEVDNQRARFSLKSSGVPGTVRGLVHALEQYGTMDLATVMAPAIKLAEEGFPISWAQADSFARYQDRLTADETSTALFYREDGSPMAAGEILKQPDLAAALKAIAKEGDKAFYEGWIADRIVETMKTKGGLITHEDLKNYVAKERTAVRGTFQGYDIISMPPPSSGGVHVIQMLNVLEGYDLAAMGHNSAAYIHRLVEAMKYAYADRSKYLGDPDYFNVPVKALTNKAYAASIRAKIKPETATPSTEIGPEPGLTDEGPDTTHFSVMDAAGNMVANTYTLNFSYGNGKSVAGAGFLLNNEMDDFSSKPGAPNGYGLLGGEANAIEPGKRPLSSMTPVLIMKDGVPVLSTGSPGGSRIITTTLQVVLNRIAFDMNPSQAVAMPRIHHQWFPDEIYTEPGFPADTRMILQGIGHTIRAHNGPGRDRVLGSTNTVGRHPSGVLQGAADPRRMNAYSAGTD